MRVFLQVFQLKLDTFCSDKATGWTKENRCSIPGKEKRGFSSPNVQNICSSHPPIQWLPEVNSLGLKWPLRDVDHLHPVLSLRMNGDINPLLLMPS